MKKDQARELIDRYLSEQASPEDRQLLLKHFNNYIEEQQIDLDQETLDRLSRESYETILLATSERETSDSRLTRPLTRKIVPKKWLAYAAAVILMIFSYLFFEGLEMDNSEGASEEVLLGQNILPGGNKAILTLDGQAPILLSAQHSGIIMGEEGVTYTGVSKKIVEFAKNQSVSLSVPRGGTYHLVLSDGTKVWLNADSKLNYPVRFEEGSRSVNLEGEAYFEVAKDTSRPFKVFSKGQEIEVLGTQFNVSTYARETETRTTLVEGKIRLKTDQVLELKPGQQAIYNPEGTSVEKVDPSKVAAWKEGKFDFDGKTISLALNEIARWYDLEVDYVAGIPEETLFGGAFRNENLAVILQVLKSENIDYKIDGNRLTVISRRKEVINKP